MQRWSWLSSGTVLVFVAAWAVAVPLVIAATLRSNVEPPVPTARVTVLPACTIFGTAASETLVGTPGDDVICALGGDDTVRGRGGDDVLFGSSGDDVVDGGRGNDRLYGHDGEDRLRGGRGDDWLQGGVGPDVLAGGADDDQVDYRLRSSPVRVTIGRGANDGPAGEGDDVRGSVEGVRGSAFGDTLIGNRRANELLGGGGDDELDGGRGDDRLRGGTGVDRLDGRDNGSFVDRLRCGPGAPDRALADAPDRVASDCEDVAQPGNRNEPPTDISLSASSVSENRPIGTVVGTLDATDADAGDTHSFALVGGNGGADNGSFTISGAELRTAAVFDFEARPSYSIRVRARDGDGAGFEKVFAITIDDAAENRAPTDVSLTPAAVAENQPAGTAVGSLAAADADAGDTHSFALVAGAGAADNGAFSISGGQLRTAQAFDFENRSSYSVRVAATDAAGATFAKALTVSVADVNEAPSGIVLSPAEVPEEQGVGTIVGTLTVGDQDAGQTHAFELVSGAGDDDNDAFEVAGEELRTREELDFETDSSLSVRVRATDDGTPPLSAEQALTVTVIDTNEPGVGAPQSVSTPEDTATTITLSGTDSDGPNDLTFAIAVQPEHGTLGALGAVDCTVPAPNTCEVDVEYTPDPDFNGDDSFKFTVDDGAGESSPSTVSITVAPVNDAPVALAGSRSVGEDGSLALNLGALVTDVETADGDLTYEIVSQPAHGTATTTGYTPDPNFNGSDSLTYRVTDRGDPDNCSAAPCDGPETSSTETVSITVDPINDAPVAAPGSRSVGEDGSLALNLGALVTDVETADADLTYEIVDQPAHGTATETTYTPAQDFNGSDSLTYRVTDRGDPDNCSAAPCDGSETSSTETVSITVDPVNDAPVALAGSRSVGEDVSLALNLNALVTDVETADGNLTYEIVDQPAHGTATETTYTPDPNFNGSDSLTYRVTDRGDPDNCSAAPCDATETSSTETVSITVDPVNDTPTAAPTTRSVDEDGALPIDLAALVADVETADGDLLFDIVSPPASGDLSGTGGARTYTPDPDFNGSDSFTYRVADRGDPDDCGVPGPACDAPEVSSTETVSITVNAINDAPVNVLPAGPVAAVQDTDTPIAGISITDVDAGLDDVGVELSVSDGTLTVDTTVLGGVGALQVAGNGTDTVAIVASLAQINTTLASPAGLVYHGDAAFTGTDTLTVDTSDLGHNGTGGPQTDSDTLAIVVSPPNAAPVAAAQSVSTNEDTPLTITLSASDGDGDDPLTLATATPPSNGSLGAIGTVNCTHATPNACTADVLYTPDEDFNGSDSFTFTANDGTVDSAPATVSITVNAINDVPELENTEAGAVDYTENDGATAITATTTVADVDSPNFDTGTLTVDYSVGGTADDRFEIADQGTGPGQIGVSASDVTFAGTTIGSFTGGTGTTPLVVTLNANATPPAVQALIRAVTYRNVSEAPSPAARTARFVLTDGDGGTSAAATRAIALTAVNDAPALAANDATALTYNENDTATAIAPALTATDVDSPNLTGATVEITTGYQNGQDVLSFTDTPEITGTFSLAQGRMTLSGTATVAQYQAALRDVRYSNGSENPSATPRTVSFQADDGQPANNLSNIVTRNLSVVPVNDNPVADDETFNGNDSAIGNTAMVVNDPDDAAPNPSHPKTTVSGDILAGDNDVDGPGPLVITAETKATDDGGSVTIEADGDFTFHPAASASCTDASDFFDYTVSDQNAAGPGPAPGTDTGRVTIAIAGCVWYVSNIAAGNSGTSAAPFDTLAQAEAASGANHTVFVFDGDNTTAGLGGDGYAMNAGERLIGEHEGLVVDPDVGGALTADTLHPPNAGAHPTLTATSADVIDLDDGNEIRGLNVDPQNAGGIAGTAGDTGGGTIDDVNVVDTFGSNATQAGLELSGTTGTFNVTNLSVNTNAAGVLLTNAGTTDFGSTTITSNGLPGLSASGTNMSTSTFDAITVNGSTNGGVSMTNTTGTTVFGDGTGVDLALTTTSGTAPAFALSNAGTITVAAAGTDNVSATGGPAVDVTGTTVSALEFDEVDSTNSAADGISLAGLGAATFTANSASSITNAGTIAFELDGGTGAVTFDGTITDDVGQLVRVNGTSGGTKDFNGNITDGGDGDGSGVALTSNTGATIRFDGGLTLATGANAAFAATGGGTVTVTDPNALGTAPDNTLATTTGTALNVSSTTIGDNDLNFRSIASNGASSGVTLSSTANANGRLVVTGNGGACTSAATCSGGAIQSSSGAGVVLTSVPGGASLTRSAVTGGQDDGIRATTVGSTGGAGLDLAESFVSSNGNAVGERGLDYDNVIGSSSITNSTVRVSSEDNARWENDNGTLGLTVTGSAFADNSAVSGADGLLLLGDGTATMTANITGNTFTHNRDDGFQTSTKTPSTAQMNVTFSGNDVVQGVNNVPNNAAVTVSPGSSSDLRFKMDDNDLSGSLGSALILNPGPDSTAAASYDAIVTNNRIGTGVADSGSANGIGIWGRTAGNGVNRFEIRNNTIRNFQQQGMYLRGNEGTGQVTDYTVTGNTVTNPDGTGFRILLEAGSTAGDSTDVCADFGGAAALRNTVASGGSPADIGVARDFAASTLTLRDFAGGDLSTYFNSRNTGTPGSLTAILSNLAPAGSAAACALPATPPLP